MRLIIESDYQALSNWAANYVAQKINKANRLYWVFLPVLLRWVCIRL